MPSPLNIAAEGIDANDVRGKLASSTDEACADCAPLQVMFIGIPDRLPLSEAELVVIETYLVDILDEVLG